MPEITFTQDRLNQISPPKSKQRDYWRDRKTEGLTLAVSPGGKKVFVLYRWIAGRPERIPLGPWPDLRLDEARARAKELNAVIARGENPARQRRTAQAEITLGELFAVYIEDHAKPNKRSWQEDERKFNLHLTRWKNRRLSEIDRMDVQKLHADIGKNRGRVAANRLIALLRKMLNMAIDNGWITTNPAHRIRRFPEESRKRFLDGEELKRFFSALEDFQKGEDRDFADCVLLILLTGARKSEVQSMRWENLHREPDRWNKPHTKQGEAHLIPLVPEAISILMERRAAQERIEILAGPWIFPSRSREGHLVELKRGWKKLIESAGIQNFHIHDLRHTHASWAVMGGASLPEVGRMLGHKKPSTTQIYSHFDLGPVHETASKTVRGMLEAGGAVLSKRSTLSPQKRSSQGRRKKRHVS